MNKLKQLTIFEVICGVVLAFCSIPFFILGFPIFGIVFILYGLFAVIAFPLVYKYKLWGGV
jgi:hypothetical protein